MKIKDIQPRKAANVTDEVIKAWKEACPRGIWVMTVYADDDTDSDKDAVAESKSGYVRKPTRSELSAAMTIQNDALKQAEELLRTCWLGGDEELLDDDDYFQGALMQFQELMKIRVGEIKKL